MIGIKEIVKTIIREINKETGLLVVPTDNNQKKPKYPYYSLKVISTQAPNHKGAIFMHKNQEIDLTESLIYEPKINISFNSYSDDIYSSLDDIEKAWQWFKFKGQQVLHENNIVVVNLSNIQDRTIAIVDHYEFRQGFDVELRVLKEITNKLGTIEKVELKGGII